MASKYDYLRNFRFTIEIDGAEVAGFSRATGLKRSVDKIEHRASGDTDQTYKLGGLVHYDDIVLEQGVSRDATLMTWCQDWYNGGKINKAEIDSVKDVNINVKDKAGNIVRVYTLREAFPSDFAISDLDSRGSDIVMESLVLTHDGFSVWTRPATGDEATIEASM